MIIKLCLWFFSNCFGEISQNFHNLWKLFCRSFKSRKNRGYLSSFPAICNFVFSSSISNLVLWIFFINRHQEGHKYVQQKKLQQIIHEVQGRKWLIGLNCFSCVHYSLIKRPINLARVISDISFWFWLSGGSFNVWNFCLFPTVDSGNVNLMDGNFWSWKPTQIKDIATLLYLKGDKFFKETMVQRRWGSLKK